MTSIMTYGASAGQGGYGVFFVVSLCPDAASASGQDSFDKFTAETQRHFHSENEERLQKRSYPVKLLRPSAGVESMI